MTYLAYGDDDDRLVTRVAAEVTEPTFRPGRWSFGHWLVTRQIVDPNATSPDDRRAIGLLTTDDILTRLTGRDSRGRFATRRSHR